MRTTLTLDDDVVFALKRLKDRDPETPFKTIVNDALRRGLRKTTSATQPRKRFKVRPLDLGVRKDLNFDNIEEVLDVLEGSLRK